MKDRYRITIRASVPMSALADERSRRDLLMGIKEDLDKINVLVSDIETTDITNPDLLTAPLDRPIK